MNKNIEELIALITQFEDTWDKTARNVDSRKVSVNSIANGQYWLYGSNRWLYRVIEVTGDDVHLLSYLTFDAMVIPKEVLALNGWLIPEKQELRFT